MPPLTEPISAKLLVLSMTHPREPMESTRPETTRRSSTVRDPSQNMIPLVACPTVGPKCRGGLHGISIEDGEGVWDKAMMVLARYWVTSTLRTRDVPRFRVLLWR